MIVKRETYWLSVFFVLIFANLLEAQPTTKIYRLGVLAPPGKVEERAHIKGLRAGLKEAGYLEGKNLLLDLPNVTTYDELRPIARDYAEKKINIIVTQGGTSTVIAQKLAANIPIVFVWGITDPKEVGLVDSLARPGTNITGITSFTGADIHGKRLELFKDAVPKLRRITVLYNDRGESLGHRKSLTVIRNIAPKLGLKPTERGIKSASEAIESIASVNKENTDAIFIISSGLFYEPCGTIIAMAVEKRLALYGCGAEQGSLLSYEPDGYRTGQRGAWYVDNILKGTKPADLPVEQPTKFELVINLKTAKQIGLTIPPNVLARADRVIR
jgi:putative tryptophan/tyrosine transport system substrate-binding protein